MKIPFLVGWTSILTQLFWCEQKGYYWFWHTAIWILSNFEWCESTLMLGNIFSHMDSRCHGSHWRSYQAQWNWANGLVGERHTWISWINLTLLWNVVHFIDDLPIIGKNGLCGPTNRFCIIINYGNFISHLPRTRRIITINYGSSPFTAMDYRIDDYHHHIVIFTGGYPSFIL